MSLLTILKGVTVASALASAGGQVRASQGEARLEDFNARQARKEAEILRQRTAVELDISRRQGIVEAEDIREAGKRNLGTQKAVIARAGITQEGSPMLLLAETLKEAETAALRSEFGSQQERRRILESAEDRRRELASEASQAKFRAREGRKAGFIRAGTTLLTGAERIFERTSETKELRRIRRQLELANKGSGKPLLKS